MLSPVIHLVKFCELWRDTPFPAHSGSNLNIALNFFPVKTTVLSCCPSCLPHSPPSIPSHFLCLISGYLSSCSSSPSCIPQVSPLDWNYSSKTELYSSAAAGDSLCGLSLIHCTHPSAVRKKRVTQGGGGSGVGWCRGAYVYWQSSRGSNFIPLSNFKLSSGILSPSPGLTHISCVFHRTVLVRGVSAQPENKSPFFFLFLVVVN